MPCVYCDTRQTDPARGASPWKRGVKDGQQVLVCPACQRSPDWADRLDRCAACGSTALVRALGETACRSCGQVQGQSDAHACGAGSPSSSAGPAGRGSELGAEVSAAVDRLLRRQAADGGKRA